MKDRFSSDSKTYRQFRPSYPEALFRFLQKTVEKPQLAWDCATGNGQLAVGLSGFFSVVYASDISRQQLEHAEQRKNIVYSISAAEHTEFPDSSFDLITVGQAIHWFDFEGFYKEVKRTLKPGGFLAVIGYGLIEVDPGTDAIIGRLYREILGDYWDPERKYIDENYLSIPFPFPEQEVPQFQMYEEWNLEQLVGYLSTWSAVKLFQAKKNKNPLELVLAELRTHWGEEIKKTVRFPILFRLGKNT